MKSIDFLKNNQSQKLLTGILALFLVAGMTTPAFAGVSENFDEECPDDCEVRAMEALYEQLPQCEQEWGNECQPGWELQMRLCIENSFDRFCPIGGTVGSMSTTSLLVAGAQANMGLWSLALVGIVGAAAAITYKLKSKKTEQ